MRLLPFLIILSVCEGFNILISTPNAVKSESFFVLNIAHELVNAGHHVTFITAFKGSKEHENLTVVWLPEVQRIVENPNVNSSLQESTSMLYQVIEDYYKPQNEKIWADKRVMEVWKKRKEFDIFLTMSYFSEGSFPHLMDNDIPFVQLVSVGIESRALSREGNWITPSVMPSLLISFDEHMNFWERTLNLLSTIQFYYLQENVIAKYTEPVTRVFPDIGDYSSYYDRVALTLINGHFALNGPMPLLPSQIEIGTMNINKPKPLDKEMATFVEGSGDAGVIYFSLGSLAKSTDIPQKAKEMFLEAFRKVPQRVLWKYEGTDLVLPPNVMIKKWMPQQDILSHPKTRVFISHCGTFGVQEAKYYGVPVLGVAVDFDQPRNAAMMERKGYAIAMHWNDLTTEKIVEGLNALINDTSYRERMQAVSRVLQDQKESPMERAIWWLEYVARHKGAPHLRYAGKRLSLFQYIMLDVILFWLVAFTVLIFCVVYAIKVICCSKWKKIDITKKQGNKQKQQQQEKKKKQ